MEGTGGKERRGGGEENEHFEKGCFGQTDARPQILELGYAYDITAKPKLQSLDWQRGLSHPNGGNTLPQPAFFGQRPTLSDAGGVKTSACAMSYCIASSSSQPPSTQFTTRSCSRVSSLCDWHTAILAPFLSGKSYAVCQALPAPVTSRRTRCRRSSGVRPWSSALRSLLQSGSRRHRESRCSVPPIRRNGCSSTRTSRRHWTLALLISCVPPTQPSHRYASPMLSYRWPTRSKVFGVMLTFDKHVLAVTRSCKLHAQAICHTPPIVDQSGTHNGLQSVLTYKTLNTSVPRYISQHINRRVNARTLRSSATPLLMQPFALIDFAKRSFRCAAQSVCN